jgi:hypothetical protein
MLGNVASSCSLIVIYNALVKSSQNPIAIISQMPSSFNDSRNGSGFHPSFLAKYYNSDLTLYTQKIKYSHEKYDR